MSGSHDPWQHLFWLASRATGVAAMVLVSLSVGLGLALSGRVTRRPGVPLRLKVLHESLSLSGLVAIAAHGALLLGDSFLHPTLAQIAIPFLLPVHRVWTGIGVVAGWLAAVVVLSFYVRALIGVAAWRKLHRLTFAVYLMGIAHTLGAGSDARSLWLLGILAVTAIPVVTLSTITRPWEERSPGRRRPKPGTMTG